MQPKASLWPLWLMACHCPAASVCSSDASCVWLARVEIPEGEMVERQDEAYQGEGEEVARKMRRSGGGG